MSSTRERRCAELEEEEEEAAPKGSDAEVMRDEANGSEVAGSMTAPN